MCVIMKAGHSKHGLLMRSLGILQLGMNWSEQNAQLRCPSDLPPLPGAPAEREQREALLNQSALD